MRERGTMYIIAFYVLFEKDMTERFLEESINVCWVH